MNLRNGLLRDVLMVMETAGKALDKFGRLTVLMFDEMKVESTLEFDTLNEEVFGRYRQMQVVMARGLCNSWKQPIFIGFDQKMTKEILYMIIDSLKKIGYPVVACVSDMGPGNLGLMKELNLDYQNTSFSLPDSNEKIVYFPDAPHLLKLIRNWFLDTGFELNGGKMVNSEPVKDLLNITSGELSVCHKLSKQHVVCEKSQRQNVSMAAQLLSHTTATALIHYKPGVDKQLVIRTSKFISQVNNWFDLMNSRIPGVYKTPFTAPYGDSCSFQQQSDFLDEFYNVILLMRCFGKKNLQTFQKGILMSINSIKSLRNILVECFDVKYLLTAKLNQDALENLFSQIRSRGGLNDHPTPLNALYRLRMIILGKNVGVVSANTNTSIEENEDFVLATSFKRVGIDIPNNDPPHSSETETASEIGSCSSVGSFKPVPYDDGQEASNDAISYLAGWVAKKFLGEFNLGEYTYNIKRVHDYAIPPWIEHLSYGGLVTPTDEFLQKIKVLESLFTNQCLDDGYKAKKFLSKLIKNCINRMGDHYLPLKVIKAYYKQRIIIKIKYLNNIFQQEMAKKRRSKSHFKTLTKMRKTCV